MSNTNSHNESLGDVDNVEESFEELIEQLDKEANSKRSQEKDHSSVTESISESINEPALDMDEGQISSNEFESLMEEMAEYDSKAESLPEGNVIIEAGDTDDIPHQISEDDSVQVPENEKQNEDEDEDEDEDASSFNSYHEADNASSSFETNGDLDQHDFDSEFINTSADVTETESEITSDAEERINKSQMQSGANISEELHQYLRSQNSSEPQQTNQHQAAPSASLSQGYSQGKNVGGALVDIGSTVAGAAFGLTGALIKGAGSAAKNGIYKLSDSLPKNDGTDQETVASLEHIVPKYSGDNDVGVEQLDSLAKTLQTIGAQPPSERDLDEMKDVIGDIQSELEKSDEDFQADTVSKIEEALHSIKDDSETHFDENSESNDKTKALQELIEKVLESIKKMFSKSASDTAEMSN
ncbi:hypothetical protein [Salinimonas chungwhensis]|uniref:hypothetical protein n=1 Tax=Salinimonas chungwhensis TaxID=265425 RepID=UPI0003728F78|nr:hypothetical protein [Salinimonas chungwhensis]